MSRGDQSRIGTLHDAGDSAFASDFAHLLVGVLGADDDPERVRSPLRDALHARVPIETEVLDVVIDRALSPERRLRVRPDELSAFAARFGADQAQMLRESLSREPTLERFAADHEASEALLLLDAMFRISTVDGVISQDRVGRVQAAATALGVDPQLVAFLFRKHDVRHANGDFVFTLNNAEYIIGRGDQASLRLPDPQVAVRHARLLRTKDGWQVKDLKSGRPTILNGSPIREASFGPDDDLRVGPYALSLDRDGRSLIAFGLNAFSALTVRELKREIGGVSLLDDVGFTVFAGEVIAVVGPSGAGKTTLLSAITGIAPPDSGTVGFDGQDFHRLLALDSTYVGIVPQEDVVHAELTVAESLRYAARLRYPSDVDAQTIEVQVDRVLDSLGIAHIRDSRIGDEVRRGISGGQRKRVNLGQELLTQTTRVMFLDEPTSGLDPQTAQDIVALTRKLADEGRIIFLVTHDVSSELMALVDHVMVLAPGGRLAWFGPPDDAVAHFETQTVGEVFGRLGEEAPQVWAEKYRESKAWRKFVRMREHLMGMVDVPSVDGKTAKPRRSGIRELITLTQRYGRVKIRDVVGTAVLLAQAPILAVAMAVGFPRPDASFMFMLALSALWFGASDAVRELIAERSIWRRERRIGLGLGPYLLSKLIVLGVLVTVQSVFLLACLFPVLHLGDYGYSFLAMTGVCILTGMVGVSLGLWMSAMFPTSEAAIGSLPVLLIPQITFGGLIVTLRNMEPLAEWVSAVMITRYSFDLMVKTGDKLAVPGHRGASGHKESIKATLWDLGFCSSSADDLGLTIPVLVGILFGFMAVCIAATAWFTARSARGN